MKENSQEITTIFHILLTHTGNRVLKPSLVQSFLRKKSDIKWNRQKPPVWCMNLWH